MRDTARKLLAGVVIAAGILAVAPASAQRPVVTFEAGEGRVVFLDARITKPDEYYFVVPVRIRRSAGDAPAPYRIYPMAATFISDQRLIYYPSVITRQIRLEGRSCQERELEPGDVLNCVLLFRVPTAVRRGVLEFLDAGQPVRIPIAIRE